MGDAREELLAAAVEAHREYERGVEELKRRRSAAFRRAIAGPVTAVELAELTGMSNTQVKRVSQGEY